MGASSQGKDDVEGGCCGGGGGGGGVERANATATASNANLLAGRTPPPPTLINPMGAVRASSSRQVNVFGFFVPAPVVLLVLAAAGVLAGPGALIFCFLCLGISHVAFTDGGNSGANGGRGGARGGPQQGARQDRRRGPNIRGIGDLPKDPRPA